MKPIDTFQNRLKKALLIRNIKPVELHEITKISESLISKYLSGNAIARQKKLTLLADALNINEVWLMGYDVPMQKNFKNTCSNLLETITKEYGKDSLELLEYYKKLNKSGKEKAVENIKDLTKISDYTCSEKNQETEQTKNA